MTKPTTLNLQSIVVKLLPLLLLILLFSTSSYAQLAVPFTPRLDGGNVRVKGDIVFIGNSVITGAGLPQPYNGNQNNNGTEGIYINVESDGDPSIFSSSSADLMINNDCKEIVYAGLYWASVYPLEVANNPNSQFDGTPRFEDWNEIKFRLPGGNYIDLVADDNADPVGEEDDIIFDGYEFFGPGVENSFKDSPIICYKNVTNLLRGLPEANGEYAVANLRATRGRRTGGCSAGWTLVVIYESPTLPSKYITLFDGYAGVQGNTSLNIPVSGFQTLPAPLPVNANIGVGALEGDIGIRNDRFRFRAASNAGFTTISDAVNQANNFFNSTITLNGNHVLDRNPSSRNTLGLDVNNVIIPNPNNIVIPNGETAGDLRLETSGDGYGAFVTSFAVEIIEPNIILTKVVEDVDGNNISGQVVNLGQELEYVIGFQNTGNDDAINFIIRDILPVNTILDFPSGITLPPGVSIQSYDPATREVIFEIDDSLVEEFDPAYEIRIRVSVVESCQQLVDACTNIVQNQAFSTYFSESNPTFEITDDPSFSNNTGCLLTPQTTNFLADLTDCLFEQDEVLCTTTLQLTAADGYSSYSWSTNPSGTPVIGTTQTITVDATGTYYSFNTADAPCQSITQQYNVELFGGTTTNPVIPYADEVIICPNDGSELPNIYLCGANDSVNIDTDISGASEIIWEQLTGGCTDDFGPECANRQDTCNWNQVATGQDFLADTAGEFRLTINYEGGCFVQFYFNVYQNLLAPSVTTEDIICTSPGSIIVNDVPSGYEYSLDGVNFQPSNIFSINTAGFYTVYIRQIGVNTNPCIFTVPDVQIRERDFTVDVDATNAACNGGLGNVQISVNDAEPQYTFEIFSGGTLVNSVGPALDNTYTFENLNPGSYTITATTEDGCNYSEDITITEPPLLTTTAALTVPLTCTDGEITIYPEGGTAPYFFFINSTTDFQTVPEYVVTAAGTYNITVVDANNCSATATVTVEAAGTPDYTVNTTDSSCAGDNNGSITITVNDANGNTIEYSIDGGTTFTSSNVFSGLAPDDYDVVVQYSFGGAVCATDTQTVTVDENTAITGTAELVAPFTCTDTATIQAINVTGGVAPYTYSIDGVNFQTGNSFSSLSPGTYTITIQDANDCTFVTNAVEILPVDPPSDLEFSNTAIDCAANTTTITVDNVVGGTGVIQYQITAPAASATPYQTSPDFPNLEPETYTFQVIDENNCTYVESYTVDPLPITTVNIVLTENLDCTATPDAEITGTINGTAPFTYGVSFNGGTFTDLGSTGTTFTYTTATAGDYQFEITDGNGCTILSSVITVDPITPPAISAVVQSTDINCNGENTGALDITIDNTQGTPPFVINVNNDTTGTDFGSQTTSLPAGDYTVTVTDANSCTDTQTITITEPDPIDFDLSKVDIVCDPLGGSSLGSITVENVTGGTTPFTYFITNNFGDTIAGNPYNAVSNEDHTFSIINFGVYTITVVDDNGCSLSQQITMASPPSDLDIDVNIAVADCSTGGTAEVTAISAVGSGNYEFGILEFNSSPYTNTFFPPDTPGGNVHTFTNLIPGVIYTFVVHDLTTDCYFVKSADAAVDPVTPLTSTVDPNNVTCTGADDGSVTFTIDNFDSTTTDVDYEIYTAFSNVLVDGPTNLPVTFGTPATVTTPSNLTPGQYYIVFTENGTGSFNGCQSASQIFEILESPVPLALDVTVNQNANCNPNSGVISAVASNGTAPYQYQVTTSPAAPLATDAGWNSASTFNLDTGTYYIHALDAFGCVESSPATILPMDPSPVISAVIDDECVDEGTFQINVDLTTAGTEPYSISVDGGAFQTQSSFPYTISNLASGTHTVEINDANGCGNLVSIDIAAPLDFSATVATVPTCNNDDGEITLNTTGGSGDYSYGITPTAPSITIAGNTISGVPFGDYVITVTDNITTCTDDVSISLPEAIAPTFTTTPITPVTCFGDNNGSFDLEITNYSGAYTYEIFDDLGNPVAGPVAANTSTNPLTISGLTSGTFTVTVTQTDIPFCTSSSDVIIGSPTEALDLDIAETSNVTCNNNQGTITATASGGWGDYEYELTGDATVPYSPNGAFPDLSAGTYTVNVRDAEGCIVSETITLEEPDPITATFTPSTTLLTCFGDDDASITVTAVTGGQGTNYTYTLNTISPVVSSSGPQTSNVFNDLAAGTYSVTITDGFDCELTSVDITIDNPTQVEASLVLDDGPTCLTDGSLTLSASGGTAPYSYSDDANFSTVLGTFNTSTTFDVPPGTYAYYVRDVNNCVAEISNDITVEPVPDLTIDLQSANPTINCAGDNTGSITATATGGLGNYIYTLEDDMGNPVSATQNTPGFFTELIAGNYVVSVVSGDCSAVSDVIPITEPDNPLVADLVVQNVRCAGNEDGSITVNASGGTGIIKYAISPQLDQFFDTNIFEDLATGTYDIIVQDELGCFLIFTETVTEPAQVLLEVVPNSILPEVCDGDNDGSFSVEISGGTLPYSVSLDDYNGPYETGTPTQTQFDFTDLSGGDHIVYVRDAEGCESEWTINFPPSVRIDPTVDIFYDCDQNSQVNTVTVNYDDSITDMAELDFSLNGGPFQASNIFTNIPVSSGNIIEVRHTNGCIQPTDPFDIVDYEPVALVAVPGDEINQIEAQASGGTGIYTYMFNDIDNGTDNVFTITESGIYTVTVTDSNGCTAVAQIELEFIEICIPNYFSPNGDGITDTWAPGCIANYPNLEFDIFDRYGRKVATYRAGEFWDGRYGGTELPTGDYWYVVRPNADGISESFVGHFTLYR